MSNDPERAKGIEGQYVISDNQTIRGEQVVLRPADVNDTESLTRILRSPEVSQWWGKWDESRVQKEILDDKETTTFMVLAGDDIAGLIQYGEETDPEYRHANIDISLAPQFHGRGIGADAVRTMAKYLIEKRGQHRLTIDPATHNSAAIACYEKVGFKPVGVMRKYERGPDGTFHDGLLMDLLAEELN